MLGRLIRNVFGSREERPDDPAIADLR